MTTKKTALGFILAAFIIIFFTAAANSQETYDPQRLMFMATEIQSDGAVEACSEHRYEEPTESTLTSYHGRWSAMVLRFHHRCTSN